MMRSPNTRSISDAVRRLFSRVHCALFRVGRRVAWPVCAALVQMILMACSATGGSFGPGEPTGPKPPLEPTSTHIISKTQYFPADGYAQEALYGTMTIACPSTEVVIHGGFWFEQSRTLRAYSHLSTADSYPTNDNSWEIDFQYATPTTAAIFAVCLVNPHATVSIKPETVTAQKNQTVGKGANCPAGSTVLGGGWRAGGPFGPAPRDMYANGPTVWWGDFSGSSLVSGPTTIYAVCYNRNLSAQIRREYGVQSATAGTAPLIDYTAEIDGGCPAGTTLTAGGFQRPSFGVIDYSLGAYDAVYTNAPSTDGAAWTVRLSNSKAPVTVSGFNAIMNCVTF